MGILSGLLGAAVDVVTLPISVVEDMLEGDTENTSENLEDLKEDIYDIFDGDII
jgi:hypothetical protein